MCVEAQFSRLLGGREVSGFEDAAVHFPDERHGVGHALVPAGVAPRALAGLAPRLQVLVACARDSLVGIVDLHELDQIEKQNIFLNITIDNP